ncbi:MAG TPA: hypothetical protein VG322_04040 [Candidatus Acidoferrales bacterium]|jgi:hypothetical protein|nr:hypothetical protein [Candidatus Acidoferrales bacterium]
MATDSIPRYVTREVAKPGDRVTNGDGEFGTVVEVGTKARDIGYGEIAIKWDHGVVVIHHPRAAEFAFASRGESFSRPLAFANCQGASAELDAKV